MLQPRVPPQVQARHPRAALPDRQGAVQAHGLPQGRRPRQVDATKDQARGSRHLRRPMALRLLSWWTHGPGLRQAARALSVIYTTGRWVKYGLCVLVPSEAEGDRRLAAGHYKLHALVSSYLERHPAAAARYRADQLSLSATACRNIEAIGHECPLGPRLSYRPSAPIVWFLKACQAASS